MGNSIMKTTHFFLTVSLAFFCVSSLTSLSAIDSDGVHHKGESMQKRGAARSNQDQSIAEALKHLNEAIELSKSIKDMDSREAISGQLKHCLNCLKKEFFSKR